MDGFEIQVQTGLWILLLSPISILLATWLFKQKAPVSHCSGQIASSEAGLTYFIPALPAVFNLSNISSWQNGQVRRGFVSYMSYKIRVDFQMIVIYFYMSSGRNSITKALLTKEAFEDLDIKMHWKVVCGAMSVLPDRSSKSVAVPCFATKDDCFTSRPLSCLIFKTRTKLLYLECSTTLGHIIQGSGGISLLGDFQRSSTQNHPQSDLMLMIMQLQEAGGWPRNLRRSFSNVFSMILQFC